MTPMNFSCASAQDILLYKINSEYRHQTRQGTSRKKVSRKYKMSSFNIKQELCGLKLLKNEETMLCYDYDFTYYTVLLFAMLFFSAFM